VSAALTAAHVLTHIGLSWIVASLARISVRDRVIVVLAGTLLDLDGAGIVWSQAAYDAWHRAAGHGVVFLALAVGAGLLFAHARWLTAALAALSFHAHLVLDLVGTGGLPIRYGWPFAERAWAYEGRWVLASWPNVAVMAAVALGVVIVEWRRRGDPPRSTRSAAGGARG
jgi:hypothetical protein